MTARTQITFHRGHVVVGCEAGHGDRLVVRIAGRTFSSAPVADKDQASVVIDYGPLYDADELSYEVKLVSATGTILLPPQEALSLVDIRSKAEFIARVQNPARRQLHDDAARFCCRRAIRRHPGDYSWKAAAVCVLGYRILDALDPDDNDLAEAREAGLAIVRSAPESDEGIRWRSSVGTMLGYLGILLHDPGLSCEALGATLEHRDASRLRTPNYARSEILLALLSLTQERKGEALELLRDVEDAFRGGVAGSRVEIPSQGYYAYTEIHATLAAVRTALDLRRAIAAISKDGSAKAVAFKFSLARLSPILRAMNEKGHFRAWLEAAAGSKLSRVKQPGETQNFRSRAAALLAQVWSVVESDALPVDSGWLAELDTLTEYSAALALSGSYSWAGLLDLAEARLWLGLALSRRHSPQAAAVLAGAAPWGKRIFSVTPFIDRADIARMEAILSLVMSSYLIEHSLLNPLPAYADREDFARLATHHGRSALRGDERKALRMAALVEACRDLERC